MPGAIARNTNYLGMTPPSNAKLAAIRANMNDCEKDKEEIFNRSHTSLMVR